MSFINKMMDEINQGRQQQTTNKACLQKNIKIK